MWDHATRGSLPYHSLTSDSCLVLWPYVCSPFRHSLIGTSEVPPKSDSVSKLVFRVFLQTPLSPGSSLLSLSSIYCHFSHVNRTIWQTVLGSGRTEVCRRRIYAHSDTQRCSRRQPVPLDLSGRICWVVIGVGIKSEESFDLSFVSSAFMKQIVTCHSVILIFLSSNRFHDKSCQHKQVGHFFAN